MIRYIVPITNLFPILLVRFYLHNYILYKNHIFNSNKKKIRTINKTKQSNFFLSRL